MLFRTDLISQQLMKFELLTTISSRIVVIKENNTAYQNVFFQKLFLAIFRQWKVSSIRVFLIASIERIWRLE